ncbi:MAG: hypothetical protein ABIA21_03700 [Candidatus Aenigmatarchaeota archaeon]
MKPIYVSRGAQTDIKEHITRNGLPEFACSIDGVSWSTISDDGKLSHIRNTTGRKPLEIYFDTPVCGEFERFVRLLPEKYPVNHQMELDLFPFSLPCVSFFTKKFGDALTPIDRYDKCLGMCYNIADIIIRAKKYYSTKDRLASHDPIITDESRKSDCHIRVLNRASGNHIIRVYGRHDICEEVSKELKNEGFCLTKYDDLLN